MAKDYIRKNHIIFERCLEACEEDKNKHGLCDGCKGEYMAFDSINKAKKKSRELQAVGNFVSKAT